ncbi:MAG: response regulator [Candidatus Lokiarchaeota archaeon]
MVSIISNTEKLTEEMKKYEKETGKKAIWRGSVTEGFKRWKKGEIIYGKEKKGIGILVSEETKENWEVFVENSEYTTISQLIRESVNFYINFLKKKEKLKDFSKIYHDFKEHLTSIQGFLKLIIDNESEFLKPKTLFKIEKVYNESLLLERKISTIVDNSKEENNSFDILIVEDHKPTALVLVDLFESQGFSSYHVSSGSKALEILNKTKPKLVLLDILLPDINGFEVCKEIKSDNQKKDLLVYYITAIPKKEVIKNMDRTKADGFLLKPFNFNEFNIILDQIK